MILNILNEAIILVPFRKPSNQSSSLLKQNLNFIKLHEKDKFSLKYMNDLGHFEFGKNHIPWFKPKNFNDTININYWLEQWLMYYSFFMKNISQIINFYLYVMKSFVINLNIEKGYLIKLILIKVYPLILKIPITVMIKIWIKNC